MPNTQQTNPHDGITHFANAGSSMADKAAESISDAANTIREKTNELGRNAMASIDEGRISVAGTLHNAAAGMHDNAGRLPSGPDMAHATANQVEAVSGYLKGHNAKQMMADVEALVKKNPVPSVLIAGALGFLLSRAFRNS